MTAAVSGDVAHPGVSRHGMAWVRPRRPGDRRAVRVVPVGSSHPPRDTPATVGTAGDTDRRLARAAFTDATLTGLARHRSPRNASREQAVRHAEVRRLALAIHDSSRALKDNRAQLQSIVGDSPGTDPRQDPAPPCSSLRTPSATMSDIFEQVEISTRGALVANCPQSTLRPGSTSASSASRCRRSPVRPADHQSRPPFPHSARTAVRTPCPPCAAGTARCAPRSAGSAHRPARPGPVEAAEFGSNRPRLSTDVAPRHAPPALTRATGSGVDRSQRLPRTGVWHINDI
jgi:hypothetical protein